MSFLNNLFGTKVDAPKIEYTPPGFNAGGLNASFRGNGYSVNPTGERNDIVGGLANTFNTLGNESGALRNTVAPGFNDLLNARLNQVNNSANKAIGDLRQNLQARRILGSSFGNDTLARANAEFSQQRDAIVADNFLKSLQANNQLLTQQYNAYANSFNTRLNELNLEAGTAATLTGGAAKILADNAQTQAKLNEDAAKANASNLLGIENGLGSFLGRVGTAFFV